MALARTGNTTSPLADRMRPRDLNEFIGQEQLLAAGKPLRIAIERGNPHSMVLWGPPGTGKTSLARLIAAYCEGTFVRLSAVLAGVREVRDAVAGAQARLKKDRQRTVLFMDEVHRFNKAQQDAFLPYVEDGTLIFVGATTENPSFALNNALLSRTEVYVLKPLTESDIGQILRAALSDEQRGFVGRSISANDSDLTVLIRAADGDARRALTLLEIAIELLEVRGGELASAVVEAAAHGVRRFDRGGDIFYDQVSALHKCVRGSNPDAALYWLGRLLDGGCDPLYVARRLVRIASEDIGNADPRALRIALDAWEVFERLGSPEGELAIAQAVLYLASAAKSNASYLAFKSVQNDVRRGGSPEVPLHLRNAPTQLVKALGHGRGYRYAHDEPEAYATGESYFPDGLGAPQYYHPVERGLEIRIGEKLKYLRELDGKAKDGK